MDSASERLGVYRELADTYDRLGQVSMRDRFMILAADAALEAGQPPEAERLRQRLLQASRYHMLRPYESFAEAIQSADVQTYLRDLRANYPLDVARQLLATLLPTGAVWSASNPSPVAQHSHPAAIPFDPAPPPEIYPMIPPTAPLLDIYGRQAPAARPTWQPSIGAGPAIDPLEMTPAPAGASPPGPTGAQSTAARTHHVLAASSSRPRPVLCPSRPRRPARGPASRFVRAAGADRRELVDLPPGRCRRRGGRCAGPLHTGAAVPPDRVGVLKRLAAPPSGV